MDAGYNSETGDLAIAFTPRNARDYALLMELAIEEGREMGICVPNYSKDFFRGFARSTEKETLIFGCEHLEFCVIFLEEVWMEMAENGEDTSMIEHFLEHIAPLYVDSPVLH